MSIATVVTRGFSVGSIALVVTAGYGFVSPISKTIAVVGTVTKQIRSDANVSRKISV